MGIRPSCLCLSLLACLCASGAAPAVAGPTFRPGEVTVSVSPATVSTLPVDVEALAGHLCGGDLPDPSPQGPPEGPGGAKVICHPIDKGSAPLLKLTTASGYISASDLSFVNAEPVETPCGPWDFTLTLDPAYLQPASPLAFEESSEDPGHGVFAGALAMNTNLHLANRATGQTADFALRLGLNLAGPWALASPGGSPGASDLKLFAKGGDDGGEEPEPCIPWSTFPDPEIQSITQYLLKGGCLLCFDLETEDFAGPGDLDQPGLGRPE